MAGQVEVLASKRQAWDALCIRYLEKKAQEHHLAGASASRKKRAYGKTTRLGGGRERAERAVRELAKQAGLPEMGATSLSVVI